MNFHPFPSSFAFRAGRPGRFRNLSLLWTYFPDRGTCSSGHVLSLRSHPPPPPCERVSGVAAWTFYVFFSTLPCVPNFRAVERGYLPAVRLSSPGRLISAAVFGSLERIFSSTSGPSKEGAPPATPLLLSAPPTFRPSQCLSFVVFLDLRGRYFPFL